MKTLLLIDAHAMIHRAFHALPPTLTTKDGAPTNAVYGFFMMLQKIITDFTPTHIAICFDTPKPTFRKKLYTGYQAKRPAMDDTLKIQIPVIRELLDEGGLTSLQMEGFEADDVIGTVAEKQKEGFDRVLIVTGDRDLLQLTDEKVFVIAPKKGISHFDLFTPHEVEQKFGVLPKNIPDYKALAGDASDNYNTAKGIGPKTARRLLERTITVENLLENIERVENPKWREILREHKKDILLFKKIATIVRTLDINPPRSQLAFSGFRDGMMEHLKKLELFSLIPKLFEEKDAKNSPVPTTKTAKKTDDQIDLFS